MPETENILHSSYSKNIGTNRDGRKESIHGALIIWEALLQIILNIGV
jgi:hypothetical protein